MAQHWINKLNGNINIESIYGKGTQVCVEVPIGSLSTQPKASHLQAVSVNKKILVVDDSEDILDLYRYFLKHLDCDLVFANNGKEAINYVRENKPFADSLQLILMDLRMPVLNGYQATKLLRQQGISIPIIAVSAHLSDEEKDIRLESDFDEVLTKPIEWPLLKK